MPTPGLVLCGGGPAAVGLLVCAAAAGTLDDLLDEGVVVIEPGPLGSGGFAHYRISANSLGGAFLEALDELTGLRFDPLREHPATHALRACADIHPPLSVVAGYLGALGEVVGGILRDHPRCAVVTAAVERLRQLPGGGVEVTASDGTVVGARRAIVTMGGRPFADLPGTELLPGFTLAPYAGKLCHSSALIDRRLSVPEPLAAAVAATDRAVIVGGAHSAWSAALLLLEDPQFRTPAGDAPHLTLLHRTPIRLYYRDAEEATLDGYPFDPVLDVCPASGRVNRYGGLRGDVHALARGALGLGGERPRVEPVALTDTPATRERVAAALDAAGAVFLATGYTAALPEMYAADGSPLVPDAGPTGLCVDAGGRVLVGGRPLEDVVAYGLGAGLGVSAETGGEPSYTRRADGVWLYQHDIGRLVLETLGVPASVRSLVVESLS